jgi:curli biogenesis system outer membrane secretion channel CsgG
MKYEIEGIMTNIFRTLVGVITLLIGIVAFARSANFAVGAQEAAEQEEKPVKIAIIGDRDTTKVETAALTGNFAALKNIEVLERQDIELILRERGISLASASANSESVSAAKIAGADGLILLDEAELDKKPYLTARLVRVADGIVISDLVLPKNFSETIKNTDIILQVFAPMIPKLKAPIAESIAISAVNIKSPIGTPEMTRIEKNLTWLLIHRLMMEKNIIVLERWKMGSLSLEKMLGGKDEQFLASTYLIDGTVDAGKNGNEFEVSIILRNADGKKETEFKIQGRKDKMLDAANMAVEAILAALHQKKDTLRWDIKKEADFFCEEAKWALRNKLYDRAIEAADSAMALGMQKSPEVNFTFIEACCGELFSRTAQSTNISTPRGAQDIVSVTPLEIDRASLALDIAETFISGTPQSLPVLWGSLTEWRVHIARALYVSGMILKSAHQKGLYKNPDYGERLFYLRNRSTACARKIVDYPELSESLGGFYEVYLSFLPYYCDTPEQAIEAYKHLTGKDFRAFEGIREALAGTECPPLISWSGADDSLPKLNDSFSML